MILGWFFKLSTLDNSKLFLGPFEVRVTESLFFSVQKLIFDLEEKCVMNFLLFQAKQMIMVRDSIKQDIFTFLDHCEGKSLLVYFVFYSTVCPCKKNTK